MDKDADKFSIYVVEDDDAVLRSLCALLIAHGFETVACTSAEQFLDRYDPAKKAFMILDLRLPGMSGLQLQTHLNELNVKIPIVVVTGHGEIGRASCRGRV